MTIKRRPRAWTREDKQFLRLYYNLHGTSFCARELRRSCEAVIKMARWLGLHAVDDARRLEAVRAAQFRQEQLNPLWRSAQLPAQPTAAPPGTPEKIDVLQARAMAGQLLFHPHDFNHQE